MIAKTINKIGIPHGYFVDLLDISIPHEYDKCYYFLYMTLKVMTSLDSPYFTIPPKAV